MSGSNGKFTKKRFSPSNFSSPICYPSILLFGAGVGDYFLFGRCPRNQIGAKKEAVATGATPVIRAGSPVCICIASDVEVIGRL